MIQHLTLDGWQPTHLNKLMRLHPNQRSRQLKEDARSIGIEAKCQGLRAATGPRRVSFVIRHQKGRATCDPDALFKSTLDGLKKCALIVDDDRHQLELGSVTYQEWPRRGLLVVLEDLPEEA